MLANTLIALMWYILLPTIGIFLVYAGMTLYNMYRERKWNKVVEDSVAVPYPDSFVYTDPFDNYVTKEEVHAEIEATVNARFEEFLANNDFYEQIKAEVEAQKKAEILEDFNNNVKDIDADIYQDDPWEFEVDGDPDDKWTIDDFKPAKSKKKKAKKAKKKAK